MDANHRAAEAQESRNQTTDDYTTTTYSSIITSEGTTNHTSESSSHANNAIAEESDQLSPEEINNPTAAPIDPVSTTSSTASSHVSVEGRWGETEAGEPVSRRGAMEDLEGMRRELTRLSLHRTRSTTAKSVRRLKSRASRKDEEKGESDTEAEGGFDLGEFLMGGHLERRTTAGEPAKKVGVVFKNLTVKGVETGASFVRTLPHAVVGTFGPDLYNVICRFVPQLRFGKKPPIRDLIHDFSGAVREGEMMLVLGRPGAGCTTFLKAIANDRGAFAAVEGEVSYGGLSAEDQNKYFRGEVNYNPEDDQHFPSLTVWQTLKFSLANKTRKHDRDSIPIIIDALLKMFGISHTKNTLVGNEYVRGVSGGERKRVSIAETLATKSTVVCWDNSTRGLDASTALDYAKSLRIMTDVSKRTTLVTLYQAGESIYELMDKVMVIDQGRMLYQGPAIEARQYFIDLGFYCPEQSTTADFLTSLCDPNARQFQPGCEASTPKTAEELEQVFKNSKAYQYIANDVSTYEQRLQETEQEDTRTFQKTVARSKSKTVSKKSPYTVSLVRQVAACVKREFWLLWGDKTSLYTKYFIIISNGLIVSSLFYGESLDTSGAFSRGGALFFSVLFLGWLQLTELMPAVTGRGIVARHKDYAFYRPSAVSIARVVVDFPAIFAMVVPFTIIVYFMAGLDVTASKFFIYFLFVYTTTFCITSLYRMFAALSPTIDDAVRFAGIALNLLILYVGYVIPKQTLVNDSIWFGWLFYVNPLSYSYEAVLSNEFSDRTMECAPSQLVPQGPGAVAGYQGCALTGSPLGQTSVPGSQYLQANFQFTRHHLWRNFGVVIAFTVLYILVTIWAAEFLSFVGGGGGALVFKKSKRAKQVTQQTAKNNDEEKVSDSNGNAALARGEAPSSSDNAAFTRLSSSERCFTWSNVEYTVPYGNGTRKLLNNVNGFAKPGVMIALMGASGAGKTTLLNTLAQRQKMGVVKGEMLVDGHPLGADFQRGTGFCEQMDLHDNTSTIREAFEFSAILRQDRSTPRQEKIDYVNRIIDLLELEDIQDAIIGSLNVEQKKRVTIGVELAAKPSLLLFLDEPTSGLDSQAAFSIVRFLKKLSQAGQAIVCTIHQPSSMLIQQFDMILALNPGGNTFYFGPVGHDGSAVIKYFADRGFVCPPSKNVAEFILETAAKATQRNGKQIDWNEEWRNSDENKSMLEEIENIKTERSKVPVEESGGSQYEFAAPTLVQTQLLTKRLFLQYWRDPSYYYGKLFVSVIIGIFNGFTFWMLPTTVASMQDRMFSVFLIILIPPIIMNSVVPKFYINRALWEAREYPSRIYGWVAFATANVVCEIPAAIITGLVYWLLWYYPVGLPTDSSTAGYVFLMSMLFFLFQASWGQWICAFAPSFTVISNVLPFFFVMVNLFNGIVRPYAAYPVFWKYWMYYVNPVTWWLRGVLSAVLPDVQIECATLETTRFDPPPGQTCQQYAGNFVNKIAKAGYLVNGSATQDCQYCPYTTGEEYMANLNVHRDDKWRCFGIFLAFVIINWMLVYFFVYTVRVRGWSFGLGYVFGLAGVLIDRVKGLFKRKEKSDVQQ
ncbi:ABC multidrug transporter atrF [Penicillium subrubescens]|uniref:ABC multidrug transporter atrF n=1 Tax=Penicillium subrubescens TaxID=1316194 RepID=A0A1Q5UR26_9EURO|nr:ABC multidrug transporter atrF [Penicillium subrubescens]KAJ5896051.1 ABC multidrug transporter atrF [Penicillium subrubescens]OKP14922.1 Brefeldin A resistance protein [Penicillium subrubescens]